MPTLSRIFIYPIKSTAAIELSEAEVLADGIARDRRYVVADERGRFLTARRFPHMVLVRAEPVAGGLDISAPRMPDLRLRETEFPKKDDSVTIWKDEVVGQHCGAEADQWFTRFLGIEARLRFMGPSMHRPARGGGTVTFADAAALLVLSEASIEALNTHLIDAVEVRNFRPNLLVSGSEAYAEDKWPEFGLGAARLKPLWRCTRCIMTTVHPDTGEKHPQREPLATLEKIRGTEDGQAEFGMNLSVIRPGKINVGQSIELTVPSS